MEPFHQENSMRSLPLYFAFCRQFVKKLTGRKLLRKEQRIRFRNSSEADALFADISVVQSGDIHRFTDRDAVIFDVVINLASNIIKTKSMLWPLVMIAAFVAVAWFKVSAIVLIIICALIGLIYNVGTERKKEEK